MTLWKLLSFFELQVLEVVHEEAHADAASKIREIRETAKRNADREAKKIVALAVQRTVATAGRAVFFSGVTVMLGLVGLVLFDFAILRSIGIAGAITVALAVIASLTLLPALLGVLGALVAIPVAASIILIIRQVWMPRQNGEEVAV